MKNRFDLENEIGTLYNFAEQLNTLANGVGEKKLTDDEIMNALSGLRVMLNLQADKLYDTMCQCFNLEPYKS